jgi:hypothetical protein
MTCGRRSQSIAISHAAEYVEQLSDLLTVVPSYQWEADKGVPLQHTGSTLAHCTCDDSLWAGVFRDAEKGYQ